MDPEFEKRTACASFSNLIRDIVYTDLPEGWTCVNRIKYRYYPTEHQFVGPFVTVNKMKTYLTQLGSDLVATREATAFKVHGDSEYYIHDIELDPAYDSD
jgi:hypothetical protein